MVIREMYRLNSHDLTLHLMKAGCTHSREESNDPDMREEPVSRVVEEVFKFLTNASVLSDIREIEATKNNTTLT